MWKRYAYYSAASTQCQARVYMMLLPQEDYSGGVQAAYYDANYDDNGCILLVWRKGKSWMGHREYYCPRPMAPASLSYYTEHRRRLQQPLQGLYSVRDRVRKAGGVPAIVKCTMSYKVVNVSTCYYYCTITYYLVPGTRAMCTVLERISSVLGVWSNNATTENTCLRVRYILKRG